jgi:transcriptional antiterminator NusG
MNKYKIVERIRIKTGPFASFTGKVEEVPPADGKLKVVVEIFARTTPIELLLEEVEKLDAPRKPWTGFSNN